MLDAHAKVVIGMCSMAIIVFSLYGYCKFDERTLINGGILSGGLHALTGPDHIAALLPKIVGKRWILCFAYGAIWGLGHGLATSFMGAICYYVKTNVLTSVIISGLVRFSDFAVGFTLIAIGIIGIWEFACGPGEMDSEKQQQVDSPSQISSTASIFFIFTNGILLGFSWDSLPSLAPALSTETNENLTIFLASYCFGTLIVMASICTLIGSTTTLLTSTTANSTFPNKLAFTSSVAAAVIGLTWVLQACVRIVGFDDSYTIFSFVNCIIAVGCPLVVVAAVAYAFFEDILAAQDWVMALYHGLRSNTRLAAGCARYTEQNSHEAHTHAV